MAKFLYQYGPKEKEILIEAERDDSIEEIIADAMKDFEEDKVIPYAILNGENHTILYNQERLNKLYSAYKEQKERKERRINGKK